jgi:hypothetical protein
VVAGCEGRVSLLQIFKRAAKILVIGNQCECFVKANGAFGWCTVDRPQYIALVVHNGIDREHRLCV